MIKDIRACNVNENKEPKKINHMIKFDYKFDETSR